MNHKIVIPEFMDESAVQRLRNMGQVLYRPDLVEDRKALLHSLSNANALIVRNRTQVDHELITHAPDLKVIGRLGVGLDNINMALCTEKGVTVYPALGANARAVAEYVIAAALLLLRQAYFSGGQVIKGKWPRTKLSQGLEISNRTLGIIGFGDIGRLTANLANGLGMQILAYDPNLAQDSPVWRETRATRTELNDLLGTSDVVSLHIPLNDGTRHLINAHRLALMKTRAVLINTSRGGIVDEQALVEALVAGKLRGAALDVFEDEPVKADNAFPDIPNLILTPHIAGLTEESNVRVSETIAEKVIGHLAAEL